MIGFYKGLVPQPPYSWFASQWARFAKLQSQDQLPHALLLYGPDGCGGEDLAMAMAQSLLCAAGTEAGCCDKCKPCRLLAADAHPDLVAVLPEEGSQFIKVDAVRSINEFASKTAQQGGRKVVLICPAEAMNVNAANALLKNLEEPTANTVFILVCYDPAGLLPTIRSRCSSWAWGRPADDQANAWLTRNQIRDHQAKLARTGGRPLQVLEWENAGTFELSSKVEAHLMKFLSGAENLTATAKALSKVDLGWLLDFWLRWAQQQITQLSSKGRTEVKDLFRLTDLVIERKSQVSRGFNPNGQLVVEELLCQVSPKSDLARCITRE